MTHQHVAQRPLRLPDVELRLSSTGGILRRLGAPEGEVALNPTALAIWELCDGGTDVEEMVEAICAIFEVLPQKARADIEQVLADMHRAGLLA